MIAGNHNYKILALAFYHPKEELIEGFRELPMFKSTLDGVSIEDLRGEHNRVFSLSVSGGVAPYETEYGITEIFLKTQMMADIGGFYRAFGMEAGDSGERRADYIGTELDFMHSLCLKEKWAEENGKNEEAKICDDAKRKFLRDHLGRWAPFVGLQIVQASTLSFYQALGQNLSDFIKAECKRLNVQIKEKSPEYKPIPVFEDKACSECEGADSEA